MCDHARIRVFPYKYKVNSTILKKPIHTIFFFLIFLCIFLALSRLHLNYSYLKTWDVHPFTQALTGCDDCYNFVFDETQVRLSLLSR